jgi:hypothetical protein
MNTVPALPTLWSCALCITGSWDCAYLLIKRYDRFNKRVIGGAYTKDFVKP